MALDLANELLRRAQDTTDSTLLMLAHLAMGDTLYEMGQFSSAFSHLETAITLYMPQQHQGFAFAFVGLDIKVNCQSYAAASLWQLGYPDQAVERADSAVAWAQRLSHAHSLAFAEGLAGNVRKLRCDLQALQRSAEHLLALSVEHGFPLWSAQALVQLGWAMVEQGEEAEGIRRIREGLAAFRTTGADIGRPYFLSLLVEACLKTGRFEEGLSVLTEAEAVADQNENHSHDAELFRLKGELLLKQDHSNAAEARQHYQRAIDIARGQDAKSNELRATISLARLLASQGRRDEARAMLAEIYGWFTEGFDTRDLKEAKALLDELSTVSVSYTHLTLPTICSV